MSSLPVLCAAAQETIPLFSAEAYRFGIASWSVDTRSKGGKQISIVVPYWLESGSKYAFIVVRGYSDRRTVVFAKNLEGPASGELKIEFDDLGSELRYGFSLYDIAKGKSAPASIRAKVYLDFSFRSEPPQEGDPGYIKQEGPNKAPEPTPGTVTPRAMDPKVK